MPLSERGQAAIFVALLFNVLFVFFAMAINIALVVHDKINLQNSADLAAYYAATKQAELLNVIAHENYQIRQAYKLLSWRYRVLGTMGLYQAGVVHPVWSGDMSDAAFAPAFGTPSLCITYKPTWQEVPQGENLCNRENLRIPPLPQVQVIAGFLGLNLGIAALAAQLRQQFDIQCQKHGAYNWWFAMSILTAFRVDQHNRKLVVKGLAQNLAKEDILDLDGNSVLTGARETFIKNLTFANRQSFENGGGNFEILNSLANIDQKQWLPTIDIIPTLYYTDVDSQPGCNASPQTIHNLPERQGARDLLNAQLDPGGKLQALRNQDFLQNSDFQYSIGFEKNPWYMAYMGVRAETNPRQVFFPFGSGVKMVARAFAKPFGGRIGPWYSAKWEKGTMNSDGDLVDPLMAPRVLAGGLMNSQQDPRRLPNYSRYPGDALGVGSAMALNALTGLGGITISFDAYANIAADMAPGAMNDPMAWLGNAPDVRNFEIAAVAPDLFDVTYYSIEPNLPGNYLKQLQTNGQKLGIPAGVPIRADLGANGTAIPNYSVQEQMQLGNVRQKPEAYYFIRNKAHLLTAWLPAVGAFKYDLESSLQNFGKCTLPDDGLKYKNPGSCVAGGGRTGYSVKLVSRDALKSSQHKIGGAAAPNAILNPPPAGW
jgi:hypothetical protein